MYVPFVAKGLIFLSFTLIVNSEELDDENIVDMGGKDVMIGGLDSFDEIVLGIKFRYSKYNDGIFVQRMNCSSQIRKRKLFGR